jgi:hypothetical protein
LAPKSVNSPPADVARLLGEPVVIVGVNKSLGGKAVNLHLVAIDLEILRPDANRSNN